MSGSPIIKINDVSMRFNLSEEKTDTFKEFLLKKLKGSLRFNEFWALKNVSLTVNRGDSIALIGRNGSGKSTLLKLIAGVIAPTKGQISTDNATIAPLIELGAGFDPDLTGHENIYLNGAVMGFDRKFMDEHYDDIMSFSELGEFINVPVKNYSSGMVARLGFSIATIVNADILIVDEILAVGDFAFQEKCHKRIESMLSKGTTLLFVSHSMDLVKSVCSKALLLDHGEAVMFGDCSECCDRYEQICRA